MESRDGDTIKRQVEREFGARAEAYVQSASHASGDDLARLVELAQPGPETDALDVATGGGHTALAIARHAHSVVASDLSQSMLDSAAAFIKRQGQTNVRFVQADAEALPFPDGSFDLVTCRIAPHHFPNIVQAVREWARVAKPGGRIVLEDSVAPEEPELDEYINTFERIRDYTHGRSYTTREWLRFFEEAGLQITHTEYWHKTHPFQDWVARGAMLNPQQDRAQLDEMFRNASPEAQSKFQLVSDRSGNPESYTDEKIMIVALKPQA